MVIRDLLRRLCLPVVVVCVGALAGCGGGSASLFPDSGSSPSTETDAGMGGMTGDENVNGLFVGEAGNGNSDAGNGLAESAACADETCSAQGAVCGNGVIEAG